MRTTGKAHRAEGAEFGFMGQVPKRAEVKPATPLEAVRKLAAEAHAAYLAHGPLVRATDVAEALGVSHARVGELMDSGRIAGATVGSLRFVSADAAVRYVMEGPRRPGRPRKAG